MKWRTLEETIREFEFHKARQKEELVRILAKSFTEDDLIILDDPLDITVEQTRKDFRRERVLLNDIAFIPHREHSYRNDAFENTLSQLCSLHGEDCDYMKDAVMKAACRTGTGADAYFVVQKLVNVEDLLLVQRSCNDDPPVVLDVFADKNGQVCSRAVSMNAFSLFHEGDIDVEIDVQMPPFLVLETTVTDERVFPPRGSARKAKSLRRSMSIQAFIPRPQSHPRQLISSEIVRVQVEDGDSDGSNHFRGSSSAFSRIIPLREAP